MATKSRPKLKIVGANGNAINILGLAKRAADKARRTPEKWLEFRTEAMGGDYDQLLRACMAYFEVS